MLIFDGNFMLHRILRIPEFASLEHEGVWTGGVFGVLSTLQSTVNSFSKDNRLLVVWDGRRSARRMEYYPEYKGNREPKTEEEKVFNENYYKIFSHQKKALKEQFLPALGVLSITMEEHEADDTIYQICNIFNKKDDICVVSEDKDMFQLISHFPSVKIYRPIAKEMIHAGNFEGIAGVPVELFMVYKALLGDKSDNITNIPGIGPKTILQILEKVSKNNPIESILQYTKGLHDQELSKGKTVDKLSKIAKVYTGWGTFARNMELIDLSREKFTTFELEQLNNLIFSHSEIIYDDYFRLLCSNFGLQSILKDFPFWISCFKRSNLELRSAYGNPCAKLPT